MQLSPAIESAFETGATVLTANLRTARWLRREYALRQRDAGRRVWATPPIEDWESWVLRLWQAHSMAQADAPLLLTSLQERSVWTRMQKDDAKLLVSPEGMAALAEEAYALLCAYEAQSERNRSWGQTDAERFRTWAAAFDRECASRGWVSRAKLESLAAEAANALPLPSRIVIVGFDRITPARKRLIAALEARGVEVVLSAETSVESIPRLVRATDLRDEITTCALWIRGLLDENPLFGKTLPARIGVIVPEVQTVRRRIERIFRRVLMPETDSILAPAARMPFEFSLGQPLGSVPVIRAALLLLRWANSPLSEEEVSWLLLSPYLGTSPEEYVALGSLDASLRNSGSLSLEIPLRNTLRRMHDARFPALADIHMRLESMQKMAAVNHVNEVERTPGRWVDLTQFLLEQAGWRGTTRRNEIDYQARARWERLLDDVALLDFDGRRMSYRQFIDTLETQANETIFAPESHGAPVQVMGALEASGQQFDAVWFLGADDQAWPARGRLHPLLPNEVQRRAGMPHGTAEHDWELASLVTKRIAASAPVVVFSHAERDKDGELRPSPLTTEVAPGAAWERSSKLLAGPGVETGSHVAKRLEEVADDSGEIAWPREQCAGGATVLKDQAACPFRAFAARRLHAEALNRSEWGLSAGERGIYLHKVMELLWSPEKGRMHRLEDLQAAIAEGRLRAVIEGAIADAFEKLVAEQRGDTWMEAYLASEQRRLVTRLEEWLPIEAERVPFTVEATEKILDDVSVGGLILRLRADRIDRLGDGRPANGQRLLVDYKSGKVSTNDWEGMRPNEPQLPLYAIFGNVEDVCGVVFARINVEKTVLEGCVSDGRAQLGAGPKLKLTKNPYDRETRAEWTTALMNLAEDFLRGEAQVDPKDGTKTCKFCAMPGLCRVAELREASAEDDAEAGEGDE